PWEAGHLRPASRGQRRRADGQRVHRREGRRRRAPSTEFAHAAAVPRGGEAPASGSYRAERPGTRCARPRSARRGAAHRAGARGGRRAGPEAPVDGKPQARVIPWLVLLQTTLTIATSGPPTAPEYLPLWVAQGEGYFAQEQLSVSLIPTRTEP